MSRNLLAIASSLLVLSVGCFNPAALSEKSPAEPAVENPPAQQVAQVDQAPPGQAQPAPQPEVKRWVINKVPWRIVDKNKAMAENPNWQVVDRVKVTGGGDYLTAVSQAYVSARTRIYIMALQHEVDLQKELNDGKWPPFEQFEKALRQNQIELNEMFPYQVYAYDDQTGEIVMLEDPVEKRRLRQEAGLPVD